ncbi:MAG TPA: hypothetical protein VG897_07340, partial [Terriglobales bacterium]|nr:hypothetical protein [Terriglobales bacterium]
MQHTFNVEGASPASKVKDWNALTCSHVLSIEGTPANPTHFSGQISRWDMGDVILSRIQSDACNYVRRSEHIKADKNQERVLVTFSSGSNLQFVQDKVSL